MSTTPLKFAMDKAAELPRPAQDEIAREVLERVSSIEHVRAALRIGIEQLDAGLGQPIRISEIIARARRHHGGRV